MSLERSSAQQGQSVVVVFSDVKGHKKRSLFDQRPSNVMNSAYLAAKPDLPIKNVSMLRAH